MSPGLDIHDLLHYNGVQQSWESLVIFSFLRAGLPGPRLFFFYLTFFSKRSSIKNEMTKVLSSVKSFFQTGIRSFVYQAKQQEVLAIEINSPNSLDRIMFIQGPTGLEDGSKQEDDFFGVI